MGQKVNPIGLRLGINRTWDSRWFARKDDYARLLHEDLRMRTALKKRLNQAGVSRIIIERPHKQCRVTIYAARPGVIIGKKGADIDKLRKDLAAMTDGGDVSLNIIEIRKPETDAQLVAENIAQQLERRVAFRRAMKRSMQSATRLGAKGVRIEVAGRLGGAEIARTESYHEGRVPRHTLRADIDYGFAEAHTTYGIIGVKAWIFKGDVLEHDPMAQDKRLAGESGPAGEGGGRERSEREPRGPRRDRGRGEANA
jgi:small subunit ribosomal protein S3